MLKRKIVVYKGVISYSKFKEILDNIDSNREPEIEFYFKNKKYTYMIIKYKDYITFQRCGANEEQGGEIKYKSLNELCNSQTIDDIILINEWDSIEDIIFDCTFSVVDDKENIFNLYGVKI